LEECRGEESCWRGSAGVISEISEDSAQYRLKFDGDDET
jgi:hypothetical protein